MTPLLHLLTTRELAAQLKRAPETLVRWRRLRVGPPFRLVQGRVLYHPGDVAHWLDSITVCEPARSTIGKADKKVRQ